MKYIWNNIRIVLLVGLSLTLAAPVTVQAAQLTSRSDVLGTSQASAVTSNTFTFTTATAGTLGSIGFQFCTTSSGACTVPAGLSTTTATLTAQSGETGFSIVNTTNGAPYITRAAVAATSGEVLSYKLDNITNPSAITGTFFVRITTYSGTDGATGAVDTGTIAAGTAQELHLSGVTPPILVFCVGISIITDCSTMSGSTVDFGTFDPQATKTGTSVMQASTNAANGYVVTVNGATLASGANTIPALAAQTTSTTGVSQFGLNLRANTTPAVGAEPSGTGTGTYNASYGTANQYRFVTGDTVAQVAGPTNSNTFTASYIVNIGGAQAAGFYTSTLTYICTATF